MAAHGSSTMDGEGEVSEDAIIQRQKKERKELLAQIQKLKHSVPKGDKKKKKEVTEQVAALEAELTQRHETELEEFKKHGAKVKEVIDKLDQLGSADQEETTPVQTDVDAKQKKASKAQKRREKKANQFREREERIKEQALESLTGARHTETRTIKSLLEKRGLQIHEIYSDGNCLYNAITHQLLSRGVESSNEILRTQTADFMRGHEDDFLPFLTKLDTGDPYSPEEFQNYCNDIASTSAWGGHLELRALSHVLRLPLEVIQAEGPSIFVGEEYSDTSPVILTYHRHAFGLGEHYNSVKEKEPDTQEDGFS
ncbi:deubiquitinase OTUD6B-like [Haliotis asinina]|uniref:deubiquitinase OTUD6B-like n=1 Tax=Haliotis asinina TaxID=109174 RepID=UPI003531B3B2